MKRQWPMLALAVALAGLAPGDATAQCTGGCGTISGADGVVVPAPGFTTYGYVTTAGGVTGNTLSGPGFEGSTNGSTFLSQPFTASQNDVLSFWFNYVTSDGAGFADYAWARLMTAGGDPLGLIFTARTTPNGNTVPGFDMPPLDPHTTTSPAQVTILPGAPQWTPLGSFSGSCYNVGCGYTNWVQSLYTISEAGNYRIEFGVANYFDEIFDSGLAYQGLQLLDQPGNPGGGGGGIGTFPGSTQTLPILPDENSIIPGAPGTGPIFVFDNVLSGLWYDPPTTDAFTLIGTGGTVFTSATLPTGLQGDPTDPYSIFVGPGFGTLFGTFLGGETVNFGAGVDAFKITGIDPGVDAGNAAGFPIQLNFGANTGSFTMQGTPTGVLATPEPGTVALLATGLAGLLVTVRRGRKARLTA